MVSPSDEKKRENVETIKAMVASLADRRVSLVNIGVATICEGAAIGGHEDSLRSIFGMEARVPSEMELRVSTPIGERAAAPSEDEALVVEELERLKAQNAELVAATKADLSAQQLAEKEAAMKSWQARALAAEARSGAAVEPSDGEVDPEAVPEITRLEMALAACEVERDNAVAAAHAANAVVEEVAGYQRLADATIADLQAQVAAGGDRGRVVELTASLVKLAKQSKVGPTLVRKECEALGVEWDPAKVPGGEPVAESVPESDGGEKPRNQAL